MIPFAALPERRYYVRWSLLSVATYPIALQSYAIYMSGATLFDVWAYFIDVLLTPVVWYPRPTISLWSTKSPAASLRLGLTKTIFVTLIISHLIQ